MTGRGVLQLVTGRAQGDAPHRTLWVDNPAQLPALMASGLLDAGSFYLTPARVVGSLREPTADTVIITDKDPLVISVVRYRDSAMASEQVSSLCRVDEPADLAAFLADADRAHRTGVFRRALTNPLMMLADPALLGDADAATTDHPGTRLWVHSNGAIGSSPHGRVFAAVGDAVDEVWAQWRAYPASSHPEVARRPWLADYHRALRCLAALRSRGIESVRIARDTESPPTDVIARTPHATFVYRDGQLYRAHEHSRDRGGTS